ncbi:hypothetical protein ACSQ67_022578 [Phaseolus vulgaris]
MDSLSNTALLDEDDSLLFDDSAPATADGFSCSPLIPLRSNPPQTEGGAADSENRSSSVNNSANKENADWNKPQKLNLEPHQMKRKKKGGGYNLRKSLAWNRAFFTEEGIFFSPLSISVLNSEELSLISGNASAKAGLDLEVIHEEECGGTSIQLQEIEENLFMHSSGAVTVEDRKIGATSRFSPRPPTALAKASPAPVSLAKRKILNVNDSVGNRPKRNACPPRPPVASSSYPSHRLPNTVKAPSKEVKVARTPGPKLDVSASTTTARSGILTAGFSKRNQNAHPATNLQKHAGVKALSKDPKTIPRNPKDPKTIPRSVTRTLAKRAGKHLDNSVETHPPPIMLQSETEANKVSETCLPRVVSNISEKKQETLLQTTKLSGLRMPSPSLGFFSMAKAPSSHSQVHKISKPCKPAKSNIPKLQNLETNSDNEARVQHLLNGGGDAQKHLLNENFSVNCSEITGSNLEAVNQQLKGEQLKTTSASMVGEIMSTKESESHLDSCQLVHMTTLSSKGSPQKSTSEIKCAAATEPKTAKIEGFIQTIPVLEQCDKVIYSKAMDHSTQVFELDRMREDCITVSETACNTEVSHVSQENRSFHEDNVQNLLLTSQECPTVKADFVSSDNKMSTSKYCRVSELQLRVEDSSRDASIHYDVPCDVPGNFEQPTSKFTYSKANKMLREDESLVLNPGHLLDQSEFSEVSADIISNTKDFIGSGAEKSSSCLRHTLLTRLVLEVDHVNREIKESHVEDSQMQLLNENPAPYKSYSKHFFTTDKFPLADNNSINENSCLSDIRSPGAVVRADPENGNNILHSDGDWLPTNIGSSEEIDKAVEDVHARSFNENPVPINCNSRHCLVTNGTDFHRSGAADSDNVNSIQLHLNGDSLSTHVAPSEEIKKTNLFEGALCDIYTSEHNASNNHIQAMPENKDGNISMDDLLVDDAKEGYSDTLPLVEFQLNDNIQTMSENKDGNLDMDDFEEGSSDILPLDEVVLDDSIQAMPENNGRNLDMDYLQVNDSNEGSSDMFPLVEVEVSDNIQTMSENKDGNLDMDDVEEGSSDMLPLDEVQLDDSIQAMPENNGRNLDKDYLQVNDSNEGSSDMFPLVEVEVSDNIQTMSENKDGNLDMDDVEEGSSDILPLDEVQLDDNIQANLDMDYLQVDDANEGPSDMFPLAEVEVSDNIQTMSENKDGNLDMDDVEEGSSDILPLDEVQLDDNIQAMPENNERNLDMDYLQVDDANEGSSDMFPLVEVEVSDNIQYMSENNDGNLDTDDSKECSSDILPLLELQLIDNIQAISENNDEKLDIDDAKEGSSDILPLVEVQLDENIQAMSENNERNLGMDDLQMDYGKEGSSDMLPLVEVQVNVDKIQLPLDGNWLSTNIASSEENKKTNLSEHALKGCDVRTGEHNTSNDHIQAMPENEDGNLYVDERAEHLQMNDAKKGSSDILALVEVQFKDKVVSSECNSFIEASKDSFTDVFAWKPKEHRSSESSSLPALDNLVSNTRVPQVCEISVLNTTTFLEEAGTNNFEKDESPNTDMEHRSKGDIYYAEGSNKIIHLQESATKSKQEVPTLKPPPNAAPFSDEWVAAIEAAGEEILTMKGGAVQNSPTEKPQHEPGPWSPVRRKNQSIGPFDCTKHNVQHSSP